MTSSADKIVIGGEIEAPFLNSKDGGGKFMPIDEFRDRGEQELANVILAELQNRDDNSATDPRQAPFRNASWESYKLDHYRRWYIGSDESIAAIHPHLRGQLLHYLPQPLHFLPSPRHTNVVCVARLDKFLGLEFKIPKCPYDIPEVYDTSMSDKERMNGEFSRNWRQEIEKLWEVVGDRLSPHAESYKFCSTHVHISFDGYMRTPRDKAQSIIMAAIYFEDAIRGLMPRFRKDSKTGDHDYIRSNLYQEQTPQKQFDITMQEVWRRIRSTQCLEDLRDLVCSVQGHRSSSYYKWNVRGLSGSTIEFRQPPPSRCAQDTIDWIDFTVAFAKAATAVSHSTLDDAALNNSNPKSFHALYGVDCLGVSVRPKELEHLKKFLDPYGLDEEFWQRRIKARDELDSFMKDVE